MNTLFVLLDGAEDHPNPQLNNKKPLDVANLSFIKSNVKTKGFTTGRGYTHLFLNEFFTGHPPELQRAVLEALGLGLDLSDGRSAYRLSPARIKDGIIEWAYDAHTFSDKLIPCVEKNMKYIEKYDPQIKFFIHGRAVITMKNDYVPELPSPPVPSPYVKLEGDLGKMVDSIAEELNGITDYPWGCGKFSKQFPPFKELENLIAISNSPTPLGICSSLGYEIKIVDDIEERFAYAKEQLKTNNVFLHIDEIDEYSHMKDYKKKIEILEFTNEKMKEYFSNHERIVYFVDHGTSSITGEHLPITVPFWTNFKTDIKDEEMVPLNTLVPRLMK